VEAIPIILHAGTSIITIKPVSSPINCGYNSVICTRANSAVDIPEDLTIHCIGSERREGSKDDGNGLHSSGEGANSDSM